MKKIVVTGNMGYLWPHVMQHLRRTCPSAHLAGYDSAYFAPCLLNRDLMPEAVLDRQYFGDMRSAPPAAVTAADAIVHLAGISNDPIGNQFEKVTFDVNTDATFELARQAKASGAKSFVFASSCSVYGCAEDGAPRSEMSEVGPLTAYAKSKVAAEERLKLLAGDGFTVTCLRFATACGFSPRLRLDLVLNDFTALAYKERTIQILSDGTPWRPLIHVDDMARAIEWAVSRDIGPDFLAINTGSDDWTWQVRDLADAVARRFPGTTVRINPNAAPDKRSYRVDFSQFRKMAPVHQPRMTLDGAIDGIAEGLEQASYRNERQTWRYSRLKFLSHLMERRHLGKDLRWLNNPLAEANSQLNLMLGMSEGLLKLGDALRASIPAPAPVESLKEKNELAVDHPPVAKRETQNQ